MAKHKNYEILNLIGYGLAKFDIAFIKEFGFKTKTSFFEYIVSQKIAETVGTIKNRQDLFDPFFDNSRKGWWQKGDTYIHRKILIDSLFGTLDVSNYANIVKLYFQEKRLIKETISQSLSPIIKSKFKQLQMTGQEAEVYFINNFKTVETFKQGILEDARLFGDGYDFQIALNQNYFLVEVKGLRTKAGSLRMTQNEYLKAKEYKSAYALAIVNDLQDTPKINMVFNPTEALRFTSKTIRSEQINYHAEWLST